ncbi:hypothetical protein N7540_001715 [Penicillium herquei]|nr:hypothetical protein N7540_001715 [Penicillium herquei]
MLHAQLLCHVLSGATMGIGESGAILGISMTDILRFSSTSPFLMNEVLAYSALHLGVIKSQHRDFYQHHAAHLQAHALKDFNSQQHHIIAESSVPIFLFAKILSLNTLCEMLVFSEGTIEMFILHFAQCIRLHQGLRTTSAEGSLEIIRQTALHPLLKHRNDLPSIERHLGPVCRRLLDRIQTSKCDDSKKGTYQLAIQRLQSVMTALELSGSKSRALDAISVWPLAVPREYADLLSAREEEALVILAHYGALIHPQHDQWMFGNGGQMLIESVKAYLGSGWTTWLEWPLQILMDTTLKGSESST